MTGVRPLFSGMHPKFGTHNALLSLGNNCYLELIAPMDSTKKLSGPFKACEDMDELTVLGWAIGTNDLTAVDQWLHDNQITNTGPVAGSRTAPDGDILSWRTIFLTDRGANPFFIQWDDHCPHPSDTTPGGCMLWQVQVAIDEKNALNTFIRKLAVSMVIEENENRASGRLIGFSLETPKGKVKFAK